MSTWFNRKALPSGITGKTVATITGSTMAGTFSSSQELSLEQLVFPEFFQHRMLEETKARIFQGEDCRYDIIFGRDVLRRLGVVLDFEEELMTWDGATVIMRSSKQLSSFLPQHPSNIPTEVLVDWDPATQLMLDTKVADFLGTYT